MTSRDVVVVGAGPAGAAVATFLRQRGRDVVLLDAAHFPRDKVCGESVSPEAWPVLAALGAADAVRGAGAFTIRGMRLTAPDGTSFRGDYRGGVVSGFGLRREVLDQVLLDAARAAGVEVRERTRVVAPLVEGGAVTGVTCTGDSGPGTVRARLVIGADGRRSVLARSLGLLREHRRLRKFAVRGHWAGVEGLEERGEMHVGGGGYCGVAPLASDAANVTFVLDRSQLAAAAGDLTGFYLGTLSRWPRLRDRLSRGRLMGPARAVGPLALVARRVSAPGALLVGDAAGFYDPFTGEGVTLALRSARLAAEVADRALDARALGELQDYDRRRGRATRDKFLFNRLVQQVVAHPRLANLLARRLARRPDLADLLVGIAGDHVPARRALAPRLVWRLVLG